MTHTGHAGAQGHTDHTDEPHNHPNPPRHNPHVSATTEAAADSTAGRGQLQPFSRRAGEPPSGPLPAADSEEAAPCEPTLPPPAPSTQSASPRLLEGGRRNEWRTQQTRSAAAGMYII
jgi:hypothetical protein